MNNGFTENSLKKSIISNEKGDKIESVVYTDPNFAKRIISYFSPQFDSTDTFLDPCRGAGAFYDNFPMPDEVLRPGETNKGYCELQEGKDFFDYENYVDWIITNPPWRGKVYAPFANHCFDTATNVVFLVKLFGAIGTNRRLRDAAYHNHHLKEVIVVDWKDANFTYIDGSSKAAEGFVLSVVHWQKNYKEGTKWTDWTHKKTKLSSTVSK